jgi:hypothetical protein
MRRCGESILRIDESFETEFFHRGKRKRGEAEIMILSLFADGWVTFNLPRDVLPASADYLFYLPLLTTSYFYSILFRLTSSPYHHHEQRSTDATPSSSCYLFPPPSLRILYLLFMMHLSHPPRSSTY